MKIGYINPLPLNYGGGEVRLEYLAKGLSERGHDVSIVTNKYRGRFYCKDSCYRLIEIGPIQNEVKPVMMIPFMIDSVLKSGEYDILDAANPYANFILRYVKMRSPNTKTICTIHHTITLKQYSQASRVLSPFAILLERANIFLPYDKIVTVSESSKEAIIRQGVKPSLISVIPNGIDHNFFESICVEDKYSRPTIVSISRLAKEKNIDVLIKALYFLKKTVPDAQLILIGRGKDRPRLESIASNLHLEDSVKFAGYVSEEEKIRILKRSHVFGFASEVEGFGIAPLEGIACGLPLVANNIPVLREIFGNAAFYADSPKEFTNNMSMLLADESLYNFYSKEASKKAREYTWDNSVSKLESLYESLF